MNSTKNTVQLLASREIGLQTTAENTTDIISSRSKSLRVTNFFISCSPDVHVTHCNFIRRDCKNGDILGIWDVPRSSGMTQKLSMNFRPHCSKEESSSLVSEVRKEEPYCTIKPIIDACFYKRREIDENCIAYIIPHSLEYKSVVTFVMSDDSTDEHLNVELQYIVNDEVYSCAYNSTTNMFIAGSRGKMFIFNSCMFSSYKLVSGTLTCVEFNKSGDIVYIGDAFKGLRTCDMRTPESPNSVLYPGQVTNLKLLTNENEIILNNSNKIIKVDLRTNKCLFDYESTTHNAAKIPFSVDENADILCSTSFNNITRLWCLSTGKLLYTIPPYLANTTARSCLVTSDNQLGIALFQKNWMFILEP